MLARSPVCLAMTFAFSKVFCLRRGRRVLLGAAAPRSTPFQPPPATPLGFPGGHCSHGSVGSWEEPTRTTPARKGRYEGRNVEPRPARRRTVRSVTSSGDEPWANGALDATRSREGWGCILEVFPYSQGGSDTRPLCEWRKRGKCGPALPMRTHPAPPEAPLCSPTTRGTRLPVHATHGAQRSTLTRTLARRPQLNETGVTSP